MIRIIAASIAVAAPASAQVAPISFEFGRSLPLASGQWNYVATATGSEARFGGLLSLLCDKRTRTVTISRPGIVTASIIITDVQIRTLPQDGRMSAYDPLLDAMAFSRGRFLVSGGSAAVLAVPSWPEAARAIEDCRN